MPAWLDHGGSPAAGDVIVQECGVGLVQIRRDDDRLAFAAPDLIRSGPVDDGTRSRISAVLGREPIDVVWADNGPGWIVAELGSAAEVIGLEPDFGDTLDLKLGVVGRVDASTGHDHDRDHDIEIRAFFPGPTSMQEDPVTGSLNASTAQWLMSRDDSITSYVARQGTALGRAGRVHLDRDDAGTIWVGGAVTSCITGTVDL